MLTGSTELGTCYCIPICHLKQKGVSEPPFSCIDANVKCHNRLKTNCCTQRQIETDLALHIRPEIVILTTYRIASSRFQELEAKSYH